MGGKKTALYLPVLTGVRFFAALLVFFYHYGTKAVPFKPGGYLILNAFFDEFYIGVGIFFVLSGFVITYNYFDQDIFTRDKIVKFVLKRMVRIFPLYILLLSGYYIYFFYKNIQISSLEYFLNFTLLKGYSSLYWDRGITQAWSLTAEENFYLLAPIIFYMIKNHVKYYKQILLFFLSGLLLFFLFKIFPLWGLFGDFKTFAFNTFFGRCFEFFVGVFIAVYYKKNNNFFLRKNGKSKFPLKKFTYTGIFLIIICLLVQIMIKIYYADQPLIGIFVNNFLVPLAVGCFLIGLIIEKTIVSIFFEHKLIVILGYSSYAFYLLHEGVFANYFINLFGQNIFMLLLFLQAVSIFVYYTFEKPVKKYLTSYMNL